MQIMHAGLLQLNCHCFEPIHGIFTADCTHITIKIYFGVDLGIFTIFVKYTCLELCRGIFTADDIKQH